jgi:hypothetical protein
MSLASDDLDAVGGDEVKIIPSSEVCETRILRLGFRLGEEQLCPDYIGPGAAKDVVLIGDERVGTVKIQDLDSVLGDAISCVVCRCSIGLV